MLAQNVFSVRILFSRGSVVVLCVCVCGFFFFWGGGIKFALQMVFSWSSHQKPDTSEWQRRTCYLSEEGKGGRWGRT